MPIRRTRGAAAKEQATLAAAGEATPGANAKSSSKPTSANATVSSNAKNAGEKTRPVTAANSSRKRKRVAKPVAQLAPDELPHGLGNMLSRKRRAGPIQADGEALEEKLGSKEVKLEHGVLQSNGVLQSIGPALQMSTIADETEMSLVKKPRTKRSNKYGIMLGETPFPDLVHPTAEECNEVNDILSKAHGIIQIPESIPLPSLTVAGCGEVPCVLEALLRTLLSAHTSFANAALAVQGTIKRYGVLKLGPTEGCIDWNAVRLSSREDLEIAIKRGGMGPTKSKSIKAILDMVYEENQAKREKLVLKEGSSEGTIKAPKVESDEELVAEDAEEAAAIDKAAEAILAESNDVLTLDYMHAMSANSAFAKFLTFPGIGVKTAACTLLFCMQRPLFAVDTHVYRLCKWLGWVPANATRDTTFGHCDVKVPNELKYSLHQLLIKHGQQCTKCKANTSVGTEGWDDECVIEHLVTRSGTKKGGVADANGKKKGKKMEDENEEDGKGDDEDDDQPLSKKQKTPAKRRGKSNVATNGEDGNGGLDLSVPASSKKPAAPKTKKPAPKAKKPAPKAKKPPVRKGRQAKQPAKTATDDGVKATDTDTADTEANATASDPDDDDFID
jgi:endonuclease III